MLSIMSLVAAGIAPGIAKRGEEKFCKCLGLFIFAASKQPNSALRVTSPRRQRKPALISSLLLRQNAVYILHYTVYA